MSAKDIIVIVMAVIALVVGVAAWWRENHASENAPEKPDANTDKK